MLSFCSPIVRRLFKVLRAFCLSAVMCSGIAIKCLIGIFEEVELAATQGGHITAQGFIEDCLDEVFDKASRILLTTLSGLLTPNESIIPSEL